MQTTTETERYLNSCASDFWQRVFEAELQYLLQHLQPKDEILSVGCGPAIMERRLTEQGFRVVGLDVSREALACAGDTIRAVAAPAEEMPFPDSSFDVVLYIASLQFIEDYHTALQRTAAVLRPDGRLIALLLNPASTFFRERYAKSESYVRKLKHTDLALIEATAGEWFQTSGEYYLGIDGEQLFASNSPTEAALYILTGIKPEL
ncbi:MAG: class I SAM-dependent methyltransferase [Geobacter sp.]|nr:class I SAM-dependent methyltransferase [Geobacter sp.]